MKYALLICCLFVSIASASDLEKEQRWADEIVDFILDGEPVWLNAQDQKFLSIYTAPESESSKGIIVVHGTGIHPDWEQVVQPVRVEMTTHGWHTLSVQMPILDNEAEYADYVPLYSEVPHRLKAAEDYFLDKGIKRIVIVAHSQGATMASYYLSRSENRVNAFVAVGLGATQKDSHLNSANSLKSINIPVLDLYGSEDLPGVLETASLRQSSGEHNENYAQIVVDGAGHFFDDKNEQLITTISNWLDSQL